MRPGAPKNKTAAASGEPAPPKPEVRPRPVGASPGASVPAQQPPGDPRDSFRTPFLLVVALCVGLSARPITSQLDTWAHAAVGKRIWEYKRVPDHALFLWSSSEPWVAHSWLSQVVSYALVSGADDESEAFPLRLFTAVMSTAPFVLVWWLWSEREPPGAWAVLIFSLGVYCSSSRFQPRPELCTALCLTVLLLFLYRRTSAPAGPATSARLNGDVVGGAAVAALFVLWANAHGGVMVGVAVLGATAVCDLVQDRFDRRSRALAVLTGVCIASTLINPYGLAYWDILRPTSSYIFPNIAEWRPVWQRPAVPLERLLPLGLLFGYAVATWVRSPRRRWAHLAWLVGTAAALLTARRHIWLLSLVSLTVLAVHADDRLPQQLWRALVAARKRGGAIQTGGRPDGEPVPGAFTRRGLAPAAAWVGFLLLVSWLSDDWAPPARPDGATQFLRDHHTGGHVLNFYDGSSYLQWRLAGNPPLFIDLLNAYPDRVMRDYEEFVLFTPRGRALLDLLQIDWVILTTSVPIPLSDLRLAQFLTRSPVWAVVYSDDVSIVWARRTAATEPLWRARSE